MLMFPECHSVDALFHLFVVEVVRKAKLFASEVWIIRFKWRSLQAMCCVVWKPRRGLRRK